MKATILHYILSNSTMMVRRILFSLSFLIIIFSAFSVAEAADLKPGLAGTFFKGSDFTRPERDVDYLDDLDSDWGGDKGNVTIGIVADMVRKGLGPDITVSWHPAELLRYLAKLTVTNNYPVAKDAVENLIQAYGPANLSPLLIEPATMLNWIYANWCVGLNSNVWGALVDSAAKLFLAILPYSDGLYLANPLALLRQPNKRLRASELINITTTLSARDFPEPVDGVVLKVPVLYPGDVGVDTTASEATLARQGAFRFAYPPVNSNGSTEMVTENILNGRYYHWLDMPEWLQYLDNLSNYSEADRLGKTKIAEDRTNGIGQLYKVTGPAVAKEAYAQFKCTRAAMQLTLPYREDLMPGTVVAVENTPAQSISFLGKTLYGMIESTSFICDVFQSAPTLLTRVQLVAVRSENDNQEPPKGFGLAKSEMYEGAWVGMDLQGKLLKEAPASTPMPPLTEANSSVPQPGGA